jgi:hypothetical protein
MYQFIETRSASAMATDRPLFDVGQASFDCYDLPDEDASFDEVEEFFTDAFHHPVLLPGMVAEAECLFGSGLGFQKNRHERRLQVAEVGSGCSFEVFTGLSAFNPLSEGYVGIGGTSGIGAALTLPVGDLDTVFDLPEEHDFEDVEFPDLCTHLAAYAKNRLDPDACFIGMTSQITPGEDVMGLGVCLTLCGMEVKPGVLHVWVNELVPIFFDPTRNLGGTPAFESVGVVAHKISNN